MKLATYAAAIIGLAFAGSAHAQSATQTTTVTPTGAVQKTTTVATPGFQNVTLKTRTENRRYGKVKMKQNCSKRWVNGKHVTRCTTKRWR